MIDSLYLFDSIALEADEDNRPTAVYEKQTFLQKVKSFFSAIGNAISNSLKSVGTFFKNAFKKTDEKPKIKHARWEAFKATLNKFNIFKANVKKEAQKAATAVATAVNEESLEPIRELKTPTNEEVSPSSESTTKMQNPYDLLAMEAFTSPEFFEICLEAESAGEKEESVDPNEVKRGLNKFMSDLKEVIQEVWKATKKVESSAVSAANKPGFVGKLKGFFAAITHPVRFIFSLAKRALSAAFAAVRSIIPMKSEEVPEKPKVPDEATK